MLREAPCSTLGSSARSLPERFDPAPLAMVVCPPPELERDCDLDSLAA